MADTATAPVPNTVSDESMQRDPVPNTVSDESMQHEYKFNISMSCGGCSGAVERVLKKLDGAYFHWHIPSSRCSHLSLLSLYRYFPFNPSMSSELNLKIYEQN